LLSFIRPAILQPRRGGGLVWTEGQIGSGKIFQSAQPAGGWHCSVSSARPYFSRGEAEDWSGLKGRVAQAKFFSQPAAGRRMALLSFIRPAILQPRRGGGLVWTEGQIGSGKIFQSAQPAGGWHCSVSSARPYFSRGEAEDWSGLKGRLAQAKFSSQPSRRADGIAQFHPPGHTSAEARRRTGLD
jgi:hypothetical protein